MPAPPPAPAPQLSFDELGTPLRDVTFVVLDLETTGGSAERDTITEVGAVKVRGGERVGELATLVDPGTGIPPQVVALTGITTALVTARRGCRRCCRRSSSSSPVASSSPTTRPSTPASCAPPAGATASSGRARPCCAPPGSPAPC